MPDLIFRELAGKLSDRLHHSNKILLLYGARQVGKTTLIRHLLNDFSGRVLRVDGDRQDYVDVLSSRDLLQLSQLVSGYDLLFIDEAQRIPNIGINLKILHDQLPDLQVIATGSSSFELASRVTEPLTGRTWTYTLYPIAISELAHDHNRFELGSRLESMLRFGMYPEVFSLANAAEKMEYLKELSRSYLYKDILELGGIRHADKIRDLLRLLAFQTGSLVSFSELGRSLGMSTETVQRYIDLLEQSFVLFRLSGFSRNLRKEVVRQPKVYFIDLGIRNAVLENFNPPDRRQDVGGLWENFLLSERLKALTYQQRHPNRYFWRTYTGAEIDYIEESSGVLQGYEIKWKPKPAKVPSTWKATYPSAKFKLVDRENYLDFVLPGDR